MTIITAATAYMTRQPNQVPTKPATVRASRIPMSIPPITIPIARPCASGFDSADAIGAITCGTTENIPVISEVASSTRALGAYAGWRYVRCADLAAVRCVRRSEVGSKSYQTPDPLGEKG